MIMRNAPDTPLHRQTYTLPRVLKYECLPIRSIDSFYNTDKNTLERMVETYPDKPWDWESLSMNGAISLSFMLEHAQYPWYWEFVFAFHTHRFIHPHHVEQYATTLRHIYDSLFGNPITSEAKRNLLSATDRTYTFETYLAMNSANVEHILEFITDMSDDTFSNIIMSYGNQYSGHNCLWWNPYLFMDDYVRIIGLVERRARTLLYEKRRLYYTVVHYDHGLSESERFIIRDVRILENIEIAEADYTLRNTLRHIYECLSIHTNICFADVDKHIHKPWFWVCLWSRAVIDWSFVERCMSSRDTVGYVKFVTLSRNKSLPWEFVIEHPDYPWVWTHIISNPCFTLSVLRQLLVCVCSDDDEVEQRPPCLCYIRHSSYIDVCDLKEGYMRLNIGGSVRVPRNALFDNPNFASCFRKIHMNDMVRLFSNIGFKIGSLQPPSYTDYTIQRCVLSSNPAISCDIVRRYANIPWDWTGLCVNPSLSYEFLSENSDRLEWQQLSANHFHLSDSYKEHMRWKNQMIGRLRVQCARRVLYRSVLLPYLEWYYNPTNPRMIDQSRKEFEELKKNF